MVDPAPANLLGKWRLLRADPSLAFAPDVRMDFRKGTELLYSFAAGDGRQVLHLRYRVTGNELHTESPASSFEMTVHFRFAAGGALVFDFAGAEAWFVREL